MNTAEMAQVIKILAQLQGADHELIELKRERMQVGQRVKQRAGIGEINKMLAAAQEETLNAKLRLARIKSEIAAHLEQNNVLEKRLYDGTITNTRELKSVESEQAELRRKINREEEKIGPCEATVASVEKKEQELKAQLAATEQKWVETEPEYRKQLAEYDSQLKELFEKRKEFTGQVPAECVKIYERLFRESKGTALVRISRGVCLGCNIMLPLNKVNQIKNSENLPRCSNCARILIFD